MSVSLTKIEDVEPLMRGHFPVDKKYAEIVTPKEYIAFESTYKI